LATAHQPFVSVIVPSFKREKLLRECLDALRWQTYAPDRFEVILLTDSNAVDGSFPFQIIVVGTPPDMSASAKRNLGAETAKGEILAFIDDDAKADRGWLENLIEPFRDRSVAVVSGPNFTPKEATFRERCSGNVLSSFNANASMVRRYLPDGRGPREAIDSDIILCNMAIRKETFKEIRGFDAALYPCEENLLCHQVKQKNGRLFYNPFAVVYHHRRPILLPHLRQVYTYGKGRGKMVGRCRDSFRILHVIPSAFTLFVTTGLVLSVLTMTGVLESPLAATWFKIVMSLYLLWVVYGGIEVAVQESSVKAFFAYVVTVFFHHIAYGLGFMTGVITRK